MLKLLGRKTSGNVQKVLFMMEETGTAYAREDFGKQFENTTTAEYRGMNPTSKVPTLVDGDVVIWESNTILRYLAAKGAPALTGSTPAEVSQIDRWMDFLLAAVNPGYLAAFKGAKLAATDRPADFDAAIADLHAQMSIIDGHLKGRNFMALDRLTLADIALAPILGRCLNFPLDRKPMPDLERWFAAISARPSFKVATA